MKTLLLSTAGGMVAALLLAVLEPWRSRIRIVGLNSDPGAAANFECDTVYLVPPTADRAAWLYKLREILQIERPDMVLPTRDGDLDPLAALRQDPLHGGTQFFTPGPRSAAIVTDKYESFRFARAHRLPFAETAADAEEARRLVARVGFPIIAKPRRGSGAHGVRILRSWSEVEAQIARAALVFQEYVGDRTILDLPVLDPSLGMPFFDAYGGRKILSAVAAVMPDRRSVFCGTLAIRFDGPAASHLSRTDDTRMEAMICDLGDALRATDFLGLYNLQAVVAEDGVPVPIEYNGRMVGAGRARAVLGLSEVPVILHLLLGEPLPGLPEPARAEPSLTVLRTDYVGRGESELLARAGVWHREGRRLPAAMA